jgi:monoamine oxidase
LKYDVIILEARNRIGGRVYSKNDLGVPLDLGASWDCGVDGNPISILGKKYNTGFTRTVGDKDSIIVYNVKKKGKEKELPSTTLERIGKIWKDLMRFTDLAEATDKQRESLAVVFNDYINEHRSELNEEKIRDLNYGRSLLENDWAGSINQLSAKLWDHIGYILPGGQDVARNGNVMIVQGLAKSFGEKKIRTNTIVTKIEYHSKGVTVTTKENKIYEGKYVICTLPVGVLEKKHRELFPQGLSRKKIRAMKFIPMGKFFKTYLKFETPFWRKKKKEQWINRISDIEGRWNQFLALDEITKQPILLGLNQTDYAEKLEKLYREGKTEEIKKDALEVLRGIYGKKVPKTCEIMVSDWIFDEFSYGAYSFTG